MSPAAREIAIRRWSLEMGEPLSGGHRSDVHAVRRPGGFAAVLKVCASTRDAADEAAALSAWTPTEVAVRLLDADLRAGALLLERLVPGTPLPPGDCAPATDVLVHNSTQVERSCQRRPAIRNLPAHLSSLLFFRARAATKSLPT